MGARVGVGATGSSLARAAPLIALLGGRGPARRGLAVSLRQATLQGAPARAPGREAPLGATSGATRAEVARATPALTAQRLDGATATRVGSRGGRPAFLVRTLGARAGDAGRGAVTAIRGSPRAAGAAHAVRLPVAAARGAPGRAFGARSAVDGGPTGGSASRGPRRASLAQAGASVGFSPRTLAFGRRRGPTART